MIGIDSAWTLYLATRLHYLHGYDAIKYRGKINSKKKQMERPDKILVRSSLSSLTDKRDVVEYCCANFLYENDNFLYSSSDDADRFYSRWNKYWASAEYFLQADLSYIELSMHRNEKSFQEYCASTLYDDILMNKVQRESVCIIAHQVPSSLALLNGFGSDKFKDRVAKTLPFIKNRVERIKLDIEETIR